VAVGVGEVSQDVTLQRVRTGAGSRRLGGGGKGGAKTDAVVQLAFWDTAGHSHHIKFDDDPSFTGLYGCSPTCPCTGRLAHTPRRMPRLVPIPQVCAILLMLLFAAISVLIVFICLAIVKQ
jgi:hypothetical protein